MAAPRVATNSSLGAHITGLHAQTTRCITKASRCARDERDALERAVYASYAWRCVGATAAGSIGRRGSCTRLRVWAEAAADRHR